MKVEELKDEKLDYWTAKAEDHIFTPSLRDGWLEVRTNDGAQNFLGFYPSDPDDRDSYSDEPFYCPSTNWLDGGPIIEREKIKLEPIHKLKGGEFLEWNAKALPWQYAMEGPTALIAAMRAFVASKFGLEVDDC